FVSVSTPDDHPAREHPPAPVSRTRPERSDRFSAEAARAPRQGNYKEAEAHYTAAIREYEAADDKAGLADSGYRLAIVKHRMRLFDQDVTLLEKARIQHKELGDQEGVGYDLLELGEVEKKRSTYNKSKEAFEQALSLRSWDLSVSPITGRLLY